MHHAISDGRLRSQDGDGAINSKLAQEILDGKEAEDGIDNSPILVQDLEAALGVQLREGLL